MSKLLWGPQNITTLQEHYNIALLVCNFDLHLLLCRVTEFISETDTNCKDFEIRLVNGSTVNPLEGRVEVCINNAWGTICDTGFSIDDAEVICRQFGHPFSGMFI